MQIKTTSPIKNILDALDDGEWHQYKDLLKTTGMSTATLSKYLKDLEKGIVERKFDVESKEYPHPVYYRIKDDYFAKHGKDNIQMLKTIASNITNDSGINDFLSQVNFVCGMQIIANLTWYFAFAEKGRVKNEEYDQFLQYFILPTYENSIAILKEKLSSLANQRIDVKALLDEAEDLMIKEEKNRQKSKHRLR